MKNIYITLLVLFSLSLTAQTNINIEKIPICDNGKLVYQYFQIKNGVPLNLGVFDKTTPYTPSALAKVGYCDSIPPSNDTSNQYLLSQIYIKLDSINKKVYDSIKVYGNINITNDSVKVYFTQPIYDIDTSYIDDFNRNNDTLSAILQAIKLQTDTIYNHNLDSVQIYGIVRVLDNDFDSVFVVNRDTAIVKVVGLKDTIYTNVLNDSINVHVLNSPTLDRTDSLLSLIQKQDSSEYYKKDSVFVLNKDTSNQYILTQIYEQLDSINKRVFDSINVHLLNSISLKTTDSILNEIYVQKDSVFVLNRDTAYVNVLGLKDTQFSIVVNDTAYFNKFDSIISLLQPKCDTLCFSEDTVNVRVVNRDTAIVRVVGLKDTIYSNILNDSLKIHGVVRVIDNDFDSVLIVNDSINVHILNAQTLVKTDSILHRIDSLLQKTNYDTQEHFVVSGTGSSQTFSANTYHSISYTIISGNADVDINGTIINLPSGYTANYEASTLLTNNITITTITSTSRVIITTIK